MAGSGKPIVQGSCKALQRAYKASQRGSTIASPPSEAMVEPRVISPCSIPLTNRVDY